MLYDNSQNKTKHGDSSFFSEIPSKTIYFPVSRLLPFSFFNFLYGSVYNVCSSRAYIQNYSQFNSSNYRTMRTEAGWNKWMMHCSCIYHRFNYILVFISRAEEPGRDWRSRRRKFKQLLALKIMPTVLKNDRESSELAGVPARHMHTYILTGEREEDWSWNKPWGGTKTTEAGVGKQGQYYNHLRCLHRGRSILLICQ